MFKPFGCSLSGTALACALITGAASAQDDITALSTDDYSTLIQSIDFAAHQIDLVRFLELRAEGALVFDLRSASDYAEGHVEGAIHLGATEITAKNLARIISDKDQVILIYCSNSVALTRMMALTDIALPQFIALGYENVFSLQINALSGSADSRLPMVLD